MNKQKPQSSKGKANQSKIIEQPSEEDKEDNFESGLLQSQGDQDEINENLFELYDSMFKAFNDFGSKFQRSAHLISLLIKKNMGMSERIQELEDDLYAQRRKVRAEFDSSIQTLLKELQERDDQISDIQNENVALKMQVEQLMPAKAGGQRDTLKEREQAKLQQFYGQKPSDRPQQQMQHLSPHSNPNLKKEMGKPEKKGNEALAVKQPGTFESFFDIDSKMKMEHLQDQESLKDLFSQRNTKKRQAPVEDEQQNEQWIQNKKKFKQRNQQDSQYAEKFIQLSQAFWNLGSSDPSPKPSQRSSAHKRDSLEGLLNQNEESGGSSYSNIGQGIKFDGNQVMERVVQSKDKAQVQKRQDKKFEIKVVEQVSESLMDDFFVVKGNRASNQSGLNTSMNSNKVNQRNQKSGRLPQMQ